MTCRTFPIRHNPSLSTGVAHRHVTASFEAIWYLATVGGITEPAAKIARIAAGVLCSIDDLADGDGFWAVEVIDDVGHFGIFGSEAGRNDLPKGRRLGWWRFGIESG
jgi:hypothetical protein